MAARDHAIYHPLTVRIDRYLFAEVYRPSLASLGFYTFVLVMNQLFLVVREAFQRGTEPGVVAQVLLLALPKILVMTIPMALLLGVLFGMGRLSADSEVIALRASGMSYFRMARPVMKLGALGFVLTFAFYNLVAPWTSGRQEALRSQLLRTSDPNRQIRPRVFFDQIPGAIIYADEVAAQDTEWPLRRVFLYLERGADGQETFVCGALGRIEHQEPGGKIAFVVNRGEIHTNDPARPEAYRRIPFQGPFRQVIVLPNDESQARGKGKGTQEETVPELAEELRRIARSPGWQRDPGKSFRHRRALMELYWRFSLPLAALGFCLLAFPLGLANPRGGKASGFAVSLLIIILYWVVLTLGRDLALEGRAAVWLGAWMPDLLLFGTALALLTLRQRLESFALPAFFHRWIVWTKKRVVRAWVGPAGRILARPAPAGRGTARSARAQVALVDRYLAGRYLKVFVFVLLSVFALFSVVEMKGLLDSLLEKNLPLSLGLTYLILSTPGMVKILLPIACVLAALVSLGLLCRANEDTALKAAGISVFRISAPLVVVTAAFSGACYIIQDYVAPLMNQKAAKIMDLIEGRVSSTSETGTRWVFGKDLRLYGYAEYNSGRKVLQDITAIDLARDSFTVRRRMWASRVTWIDGKWVAAQGWQRAFRDGEENYADLSSTAIPWPERPEDFDRQERSILGSGRLAEEMSFLDLRRHIKRMKNSGYDTTRLRVSLYEKLAFPTAPMVMLLIGLPFGFGAGRRGSLYGAGIALVLVMAYWSCFAVSSALGQVGILPPLLAALSPNLLFAMAGGYLLLSARS